jgi:hypothetical protein
MWKLSFIYNPIDGNVMSGWMFCLDKFCYFQQKYIGGFFLPCLWTQLSFQFIENFANFLISQNWGKKTWPCICLSQFWSQYPKSNCKYVVSYSLAQESKAEGEGVGGSWVVLNQSYKIWPGPITMVHGLQSHIPTKLY